MPPSPYQLVPDPASTSADSGLRCPRCEYNLTGLTGNRCPECGSAFDPEELRRILAGEWAPIPGWDDRRGTNILVAFARVCWATWFAPGEFARRFPLCHDRHSATAFRWLARAAAVGVFWVTPVILYIAMGGFPAKARHLAPTILVFYLPTVLSSLFASASCEMVLSVLFDLAVGRRMRPHPRATTSWSGLVGFFSSFLIVTAATAGLAGNVIIAHLGVGAPLPGKLLLPLLAADLLWWWYCLGKAVAVRAVPTRRRTIVIAVIPLVGLATLALMVFLSAVLGMIFYGMA